MIGELTRVRMISDICGCLVKQYIRWGEAMCWQLVDQQSPDREVKVQQSHSVAQQWKAWSFRLVTATRKDQLRLHPYPLLLCTKFLSKQSWFLDDLQQALDAIPPSEWYVIMEDFNAQIGGSKASVNDQRESVHGSHGLRETNDAGCGLLTFLSINEVTVCNTWFPKQTIHKHTQQHPLPKRWHCTSQTIMTDSLLTAQATAPTID